MNLFPEIESFGLTSFNLVFGKHFFKTITLDSQVSIVSDQIVEKKGTHHVGVWLLVSLSLKSLAFINFF